MDYKAPQLIWIQAFFMRVLGENKLAVPAFRARCVSHLFSARVLCAKMAESAVGEAIQPRYLDAVRANEPGGRYAAVHEAHTAPARWYIVNLV